jgi:1-deoxy-D-xylulose-5-phosphate synthase
MPSGTGTGLFGDTYPDRYFDVGIAEGHGVTFAAGLATEGVRPVAAIYSTFLQRAYDSIIHDVAIQNLPVVFAMDRAGLVGNDGPTHMGLYDIAYLLAVPNMIVTAPRDGDELLALLRLGVQQTQGPFSLRYPRDNVPAPVRPLAEIPPIELGTWEVPRKSRGIALLAVGTMVYPALEAARMLESEGIHVSVVNCRFLKPIDENTLDWALGSHDTLVSIEEGTIVNGFGASLGPHVEAARRKNPALRFEIMGVPDRIIEHANRDQQLAEVGLDADGIAARVRALVMSAAAPRVQSA